MFPGRLALAAAQPPYANTANRHRKEPRKWKSTSEPRRGQKRVLLRSDRISLPQGFITALGKDPGRAGEHTKRSKYIQSAMYFSEP